MRERDERLLKTKKKDNECAPLNCEGYWFIYGRCMEVMVCCMSSILLLLQNLVSKIRRMW